MVDIATREVEDREPTDPIRALPQWLVDRLVALAAGRLVPHR
jgi:hypothetical protein